MSVHYQILNLGNGWKQLPVQVLRFILSKNPEWQRPHLQCSRSLKSCNSQFHAHSYSYIKTEALKTLSQRALIYQC
jgi:hypothetical protein